MEAPEFFHGGFCRVGNPQLAPEKRHGDSKSGEHFIIDDLLDFSNEDDEEAAIDAGTEAGGCDDGGYYAAATNSTDSSTITVVDSCISDSEPHLSGDVAHRSYPDGHFSSDLCVPYDELAELEWLSNFVEESFSTEDFQRLQLISGAKSSTNDCSEATELTGTNGRNSPIFHPELSVPGKARSKRSRAAPCNWSSRLLVLSPTTSSSESDAALNFGAKSGKLVPKKKEVPTAGAGNGSSEGRKCQHCATEKTPQWRTGPMGPKTLCNACGVRYKSGRLVPEYRPAASPTFSFTKHSNSHRKVLELRRQKELMLQQQQQQFLHPNAVFDIVGGGEYLIPHNGSDFPQLI